MIRAFEEKGEIALEKEVKRDMRPGDATGWPVTHEHMTNYLNITRDIVAASFEICHGSGLEERTYGRTHNGRKVDSGVSFTSSDRPLTSGSTDSNSSQGSKQLPPVPVEKKSRGPTSALERIAKEIRRMKSRPSLVEVAKEPAQPKPSVIKRVKSAGMLRRGRVQTPDVGETSEFDVEHFRLKRQAWEAEQAKRSTT